MGRIASDWGERAAITAVIVGGTVWAYLENVVPVVAFPILAVGIAIAALPLPIPAGPVQRFIAGVLILGSLFEIVHAIFDNEAYDVREVLIIGTVVASAYAVRDHFSDEDDEAPA